jgi:hypothetical protein
MERSSSLPVGELPVERATRKVARGAAPGVVDSGVVREVTGEADAGLDHGPALPGAWPGGLPCPWKRGMVDTVACRESTRGKRQSQRSRPPLDQVADRGRLGCRVGWRSACGSGPTWWWPPPPWPWRRCSSPLGGASRRWWIGASTAASTMPPGRSRRSAPACVTRSTWTRSRMSCWAWSTRPCSQRPLRYGSDQRHRPSRVVDNEEAGATPTRLDPLHAIYGPATPMTANMAVELWVRLSARYRC